MSVQCDEEDVKATWHALNGDASTLPLAAFTTFSFDKMFECISEEGRVFFFSPNFLLYTVCTGLFFGAQCKEVFLTRKPM